MAGKKKKKNKRKQKIKNEQRNCKVELKKTWRILNGNVKKGENSGELRMCERVALNWIIKKQT